MNIKETINFTKLREKGPKSLEIKDDEIIQLVSSGQEIKCIVTQEYLLSLESCREQVLIRQGLKEEKRVLHDPNKLKGEFKKKLENIMEIAKEDDDYYNQAERTSVDSDEVVALKRKLAEAEKVIRGIREAVDIVSDHYLAVEEHAGVVGLSLDRESARRVKEFWDAHTLFDQYVFSALKTKK